MPIFVPVLIGLGSVAVTALGGKKANDARKTFREARAILKDAKARHERTVRLVDSAREHAGTRLSELEVYQAAVREQTFMARVFPLLLRLDQEGHIRELRALGAIDADVSRGFPEGPAHEGVASDVGRGLVVGAGAGVAAGAAAQGVASSFGIASTGAAISGLTGAAAKSATLAWLGGGSLAAGGGGMALGGVILGGVVVAPAVFVGGFAAAAAGEKRMTQAREEVAKVDAAIASMLAMIEVLHRVETRCHELREVTEQLDQRVGSLLSVLEAEEPIDLSRDDHATRFAMLMLGAKGLAELLHVAPIDESGNPAGDEELSRARALVDDAEPS